MKNLILKFLLVEDLLNPTTNTIIRMSREYLLSLTTKESLIKVEKNYHTGVV